MSTQAYVDLMFAWGHARLRDADRARALLSAATEQLSRLGNGTHDWLLKAFTCRVEQASRGSPHDGSWPYDLVVALDQAENLNRFGADRLRATSRLLEPVERADPYAPWKKGAAGPEWYRRPTTTPGPPGEWLEEKFADLVQLADHAGPGAGVGSGVHPSGTERFVAALEAAQEAGLTEAVNARVRDLLGLIPGPQAATGRQLYLLLSLSKALIRLDRKAEAAALADEHRAAELAEYHWSGDADRLVVCLGLAALDLWLARPESATPVLDLARQQGPGLQPLGTRCRVIGEYLEAIAWGLWPDSLGYMQSMLNVLPHFPNVGTTAIWYSARHMEIVERVVLAITTYNFGPAEDLPRSMSDAEIAARREALVEVRGKLIEWGQKDWDPVKSP
jgi:hypothetical protein